MKIKQFSLLLALVMVLSAFAGTFTISAEGEAATATPWEVNGTRYEAFDDAINAAVGGDIVYLHEDTVNTEQANEIYYINKDVTIEGVAKPDGSYPTLGITIQWRRYAISTSDDDDYVEVLFKNMTIDFVYMYNYMYDICANCSLTFENVDFVLTQGHVHNVYGPPFRVSGTNSALTFRECSMVAKELFYPCQDFKALITVDAHAGDSHEPIGNVITIDSCEIDLRSCLKTCGLFWTENNDNSLVIRNSTIDTTDDSVTFYPEDFTPTYRGTNTINGFQSVNEDIDYLIYDRQAREAGYVARVGEVADAIERAEDGTVTFVGYYKDFIEACNAAAATETEEQKEVTLIENVTVTENLTIPTATIKGNSKTLTAPRIYKAQDAILIVDGLTIKTTAEAPILQMNADSVPELAEGEVAPAPSYAKFTKCTFETDQKVPYAYFVLQADLTLTNCKINITQAECDKPIFRLDNGADVTFAGVKISAAESAPNLIGFDVVSDAGSAIILKGATDIQLGKSAFTESSKANVYLTITERASLTTGEDAIKISAEATEWKIAVTGSAVVTAKKGSAISAAAPNTVITIGGNAKVSGVSKAVLAIGENVSVVLEKDATVVLTRHATNKAVIALEGAGSKLVSEGTITAEGNKTSIASIALSGADTSALIKAGAITGIVQIGTAENSASFIVAGGTVTVDADANSPAIVVNKGSANLLNATVTGGSSAIGGDGAQEAVAYPEGTTSIEMKEIFAMMPTTDGVSMRMNDGSLGMRFTSGVTAEAAAYAEALKACGAVLDYEFGTLIVRETEVRQVEMTVASLIAADVTHAAVKADAGIVKAEDGSITYTAAVINFTEDNMGSALTARAYVKYTLIDGSALYVYAEDRTEGISVGELAQTCLADVSTESAEGYRNRVEFFYEADEDGWYELIEEAAYSPYSKEQQAALAMFIENADL